MTNRKQRTPWKTYTDWSRRNGIVIEGWPVGSFKDGIDSLGINDLKIIYDAITKNVCMWKCLSSEEHEALLAAEPPVIYKRKSRSDKGRSRKRAKTVNTNDIIHDDSDSEDGNGGGDNGAGDVDEDN